MQFKDGYPLTGLAVSVIAGSAALLTWLCVDWLAGQPPLTAVIAVVLVELFLASFGVIAIVLAERMTLELLNAERRPARPAPGRSRPEPIWVRLPDRVPGAAEPIEKESEQPRTIAFPTLAESRMSPMPPAAKRAA
jgi:hypothetical protein